MAVGILWRKDCGLFTSPPAPDVKLTPIGKNAKGKAFDKTAAIYELAGAEDKFKRV